MGHQPATEDPGSGRETWRPVETTAGTVGSGIGRPVTHLKQNIGQCPSGKRTSVRCCVPGAGSRRGGELLTGADCPYLDLDLDLVLREAEIDWTEVERLTSDRKGWKEKVAERMEHLGRWERQKGHGYRWEQGQERLVRNLVRGEGELVCRYEGCGKVCRNKAGLVMHEKRMHRVNEERGRLKCERCGRGFDAEGQRRQCGGCKRWVSRANYARHVRACGRVEVGGLLGAGCWGAGCWGWD